MSPGGPKRPEDSRAAPLRNRDFRLLMGFRIFTILSYQGVAVTVGWHVYELTRDPWMLGLIGLAEVVPYFCVAPFAGHLVDVLPRRRLGAFAAACLAITPLLLVAIAAGWWTAGGLVAIYAAIALTGCVRAFLGPVYNAVFARVLPREQYVRGASLGSIVFQSGLVTGPAIGGFLVGWAGKPVAYGVAAVFAALAAMAMLLLRVSEPAPRPQRAPIFASIAEGARFVFGHQILLGALALDMFAVLFGGAISLAPAFITEILHYGPEGLGILRAAPALGAVAVGVWLARHPLDRDAGRILLWAVAGSGRAWSVSGCPGPSGCRRRSCCCRASATAFPWSPVRRSCNWRRPTRCAGGSLRSTACSWAPRTRSAPSMPARWRDCSAWCRRWSSADASRSASPPRPPGARRSCAGCISAT